MTLEEYRIQTIEKLKACRDPARARDVLSDVDGMLVGSRISDTTRRLFWETLRNDLDVVTQESTALLERQAAAVLGAVVRAAQDAIFEYQALIGSDEPGY